MICDSNEERLDAICALRGSTIDFFRNDNMNKNTFIFFLFHIICVNIIYVNIIYVIRMHFFKF